MKRILEILQEDNGRLSSTRLAFVCMSATIGLVWAYISIKLGALSDIPVGVQTVVFGYLGAKVGQKFLETPPKEGG